MTADVWESGPYLVRHYPQDPERLIVVLTGGGFAAWDARIEEFRNTLSGLGVSMCFAMDRVPGWLMHRQAAEMMAHVAGIAAGYPHVGVMGESMGGSSAIVFSAHCPSVERSLAFSPQFSVADPFIRFDDRFKHLAERHTEESRVTFDAPGRERDTLVLFGAEDLLDLVHAGLYAVYGYDVGFVEDADHQVANSLKRNPDGNLLAPLAARFADFSRPFGYEAAKEILADRLSRRVATRDHGFDAERRWQARSEAARSTPRRLPPPEGLADLTQGAATDQSSVSRWSRGDSGEDSRRAITRSPRGRFAFHTDVEERPWWSIDFGRDVVVREVRIYNRMGTIGLSSQCVQFAIEVAGADGEWREVMRKSDRKLFGGADGHPFVWSPSQGVAARRLRIRLLGRGALHYDRIEIFG